MLEVKREVFMSIAHNLSALGTCDRKQVGALIIRDGRCISWGYNGAPPGLPHCNENHHGWQGWWELHDIGKRTHEEMDAIISERGCRNATHAEANALAFAARQGISTDEGSLYVTVSPCVVCARLLVAAGIREVFYREEYRDRSGIELLREALVPCSEVS